MSHLWDAPDTAPSEGWAGFDFEVLSTNLSKSWRVFNFEVNSSISFGARPQYCSSLRYLSTSHAFRLRDLQTNNRWYFSSIQIISHALNDVRRKIRTGADVRTHTRSWYVHIHIYIHITQTNKWPLTWKHVSSEVSVPSPYINSFLTHNPLFALTKG